MYRRYHVIYCVSAPQCERDSNKQRRDRRNQAPRNRIHSFDQSKNDCHRRQSHRGKDVAQNLAVGEIEMKFVERDRYHRQELKYCRDQRVLFPRKNSSMAKLSQQEHLARMESDSVVVWLLSLKCYRVSRRGVDWGKVPVPL